MLGGQNSAHGIGGRAGNLNNKGWWQRTMRLQIVKIDNNKKDDAWIWLGKWNLRRKMNRFRNNVTLMGMTIVNDDNG